MKQILIQTLRRLICPFEPILQHIPAHEVVLDIGCGTGALSIAAIEQGKISTLLGLDPNQKAVEQAKEKWAKIKPSHPTVDAVFEARSVSPEMTKKWPVVVMMDVMHHIPPAEQPDFLRLAFSQVKEDGLFIYKDMCMKPWWRKYMNRLHDLVMAHQWISEFPLSAVKQLAAEYQMKVTHESHYSVAWYGHELLVLKKRS